MFNFYVYLLFMRKPCCMTPSSLLSPSASLSCGKISSWVSFTLLNEYEAPLGGPLGHGSSAITG